MDYFIMSLDPRLHNAAKPAPESPALRDLARKRIGRDINTKTLIVDDSKHNEYPDFLDGTVMLVSEKLKNILSMYQKDIIFKAVVLIERKKNRQELYYQFEVPEIDCKVDVPDRGIGSKAEGLVIDQEKVGYARVFRVNYYGKRLLVRLDVAESILRRDSYAVRFNRVGVITKEEI